MSARTSGDAAKRPVDEFLLAVFILLFIPLLPLLLEMGVMAIFRTAASRYLEPASVMIAAPMLAVAVGLASRYKSIAMACGIAALCLGALYGGQLAQPEQRATVGVAEQQVHENNPVQGVAQQASVSAGANKVESPQRSFFDKIDMDLLPERIAWIAIGLVSLMLLLERAIRHIKRSEPLELEWTK